MITDDEKIAMTIKATASWTKERDIFAAAIRLAVSPGQLEQIMADEKWHHRLKTAANKLKDDLKAVL